MKSDSDHLLVNCDGGSRGNPGPAAGAFVVQESDHTPLYSQSVLLGVTTNNVAEYTAVLSSLSWLADNLHLYPQLKSIDYYLDSLLVVNQLNGRYKVKDARIRELYQKTTRQLNLLENIKINFSYIPRAENAIADSLVNQALDSSL